ncbi:transporter [bacterium]|nr:transporter [bacterium]
MNCRRLTTLVVPVFVLILAAGFTFAQESEPQWGPIQDNSFLLEEAYNQESGVVQHINTFQLFRKTGWAYTFTQEWPVPGLKHQLSYSIPILDVDFERGRVSGLSDIALNYRYQLVGNGDTKLAIAPRVSVLLPTGDELKNLGLGGTGFQFNFPLSLVLTSKLVAHSNVGFTYAPHAKNDLEEEASIVSFNAGQSFVWLVSMRFNVMLETTYGSIESVTGKDQTDRISAGVISPGIRWAYNFRSGLQIVPGIAFPIGIGPDTDYSVFFYLSFEHPMWR